MSGFWQIFKERYSPDIKSEKDLNKNRYFAPNTKISFDAGLINELKQNHRRLLKLYNGVQISAEKREFEKVTRGLNQFLTLYNEHVLTEYTKLYVFLEYVFKDDQESHQLILDFRKEMNVVGRSIRSFCKQWQDKQVKADNVDQFQKQLMIVGKDLSTRISIEEERLYKIYTNCPELLESMSEAV